MPPSQSLHHPYLPRHLHWQPVYQTLAPSEVGCYPACPNLYETRSFFQFLVLVVPPQGGAKEYQRVMRFIESTMQTCGRSSGEFVWHKHDDTDELFFCIDGEMRIEMQDGSISLGKGELFIVPRRVEHKPVAEKECEVLLIEPRGIVNTGDVESELTAPNEDWI